jgi:hypothetical protein
MLLISIVFTGNFFIFFIFFYLSFCNKFSWIGLAAVILYISLYVFSFFAFLLSVFNEDLKKKLIVGHIVLGYTTFILGIIA